MRGKGWRGEGRRRGRGGNKLERKRGVWLGAGEGGGGGIRGGGKGMKKELEKEGPYTPQKASGPTA